MWRARVLVAFGLVATGLTGCGGGDDGGEVTTAAAPCAVDALASGPMTTADGGLLLPPVPRPDDWVAPDQVAFDWDQDGTPDTLAFDQDARTIRVEWADGALTVTGIRSDFAGEPGQPLAPDGDPFLDQPTESGPPADTPRAAPVPAAVADVTGDEALDLLVVDGGTASVVVGAGAAASSVTVDQAAIGEDVTGWRNPPHTPVPPPGFSSDQVPVPYDQATIVPRWDLTGDGIDDWVVESNLGRALGPATAYAGKPCA
jgi:hypothetical protein